jgi:hypothetical protein
MKTMTIKVPQSTRRSGAAIAAMHRNPVIMRHRLQPRGGARNVQASYFDEIIVEDESHWFDEDRDG